MKEQTRTLYIVHGSTGEYSDYQDWMVRGFFDHAKATTLRDQLEAKARELGMYEDAKRDANHGNLDEMRKLDEEAICDYTGITYFICECPVEGA